MSETTDVAEVTVERLVTNWLDHGHPQLRTCGGCDVDMSRVGIQKIVYSHEVCSCDRYDYGHMVEQLWHRECFTRATLDAVVAEAADLPVDAAIEYLRSTLPDPVTATFMLSLPELVERARKRALRHRAPLRDQRYEQVQRCERVLRLAGRLS